MVSRTVEESTELDVNWCNREGVLESPSAGTLRWTRESDGEETASMGYRYSPAEKDGDPEGLELSYTVHPAFGDSHKVAYTVRIERTECNFGGTRPWFCCPNCGDRVAKLYHVSGWDKYICRDCGDLLYESQTYTNALTEAHRQLNEASEQAQEWPSRENLREFYEAKFGIHNAHEDYLETLDERYGPLLGEKRAEGYTPPDPPPFDIWLSRMFSHLHNYGYYGQCEATAKTTGERCEQSALGEHGKCYYHGGAPGTGIGDGQTDHAAERIQELLEGVEEQRERDRQRTEELLAADGGEEI